METIIRKVREINPSDRHALEHVLGHRLGENEQLIINVITIDGPAGSSAETLKSGEQFVPNVPDWWKVYEGLSDERIDELDEAISQRANLTRVFE